MADSNITKRALAAALQKLMADNSFDKINVGQICQLCGMNRKSFYYHFRDKYDLLNWIFDTEFIALAAGSGKSSSWDMIEALCLYFYQNRSFYIKALRTSGPNSFPEHLREFCLPLLKNRLKLLMGEAGTDPFILDFYADAFLCAIERWLIGREPMPPEDFVKKLKLAIHGLAECEI